MPSASALVQATATDEDEESAEDDNNDDEDVFAAEALLSVSLLRRDGSSRADGSAMTTADGGAAEGKPRRARKLSAKAAALAELEAQEPPLHAGQARRRQPDLTPATFASLLCESSGSMLLLRAYNCAGMQFAVDDVTGPSFVRLSCALALCAEPGTRLHRMHPAARLLLHELALTTPSGDPARITKDTPSCTGYFLQAP